MPKPKKGETKRKFISRAIKTFLKEGYNPDVAKGRAYGFWETYHNKRKNK